MPSNLKRRVRERMAQTGESYQTALRQLRAAEQRPRLSGSTYVIVECIACKARREIEAGEVPANEVPMCSKCFNPMVPKTAVVKFDR